MLTMVTSSTSMSWTRQITARIHQRRAGRAVFVPGAVVCVSGMGFSLRVGAAGGPIERGIAEQASGRPAGAEGGGPDDVAGSLGGRAVVLVVTALGMGGGAAGVDGGEQGRGGGGGGGGAPPAGGR